MFITIWLTLIGLILQQINNNEQYKIFQSYRIERYQSNTYHFILAYFFVIYSRQNSAVMKRGNIHILDLDFEYKFWKNKLIFYQTELDILLSRVQVLTIERKDFNFNPERSKLVQVQTDTIKKMLNKIEVLEEEMSLYAVDYPISKTHDHYRAHARFRQDMDKVIERQIDIVNVAMTDLAQD